MKSLKHLVEKDGVTVVSVIHQPRKFIYDLFDSVILLGLGGKTVYHGPRDVAVQYFNSLHYKLPEGESVADWLIDISSGRVEPEIQLTEPPTSPNAIGDGLDSTSKKIPTKVESNNSSDDCMKRDGINTDDDETPRPSVSEETPQASSSLSLCPASGLQPSSQLPTGKTSPEDNSLFEIALSETSVFPMNEVEAKNVKGLEQPSNLGGDDATSNSFGLHSDVDGHDDDDLSSRRGSYAGGEMSLAEGLTTAGRFVTDADVVGARGVVAGKVAQASKEAKNRRDWLYIEWDKYFRSMRTDIRQNLFEPPNPYPLPISLEKPSFWYQLHHQTVRIFTVAWVSRSIYSRFCMRFELSAISRAAPHIQIAQSASEICGLDHYHRCNDCDHSLRWCSRFHRRYQS